MKVYYSILLIITTLSACTKNQVYSPAVTYNNTPPKDTLTYLALGDSYTTGEAVTQAQSFPYQLKASLIDNSIFVPSPTVIATTGWTTYNLIDGIAASSINGKTYNFVTLLIGVNDEHLKVTQKDYSTNFAQLLNTAIKFAGGNKTHVFVLSIPDYGVTPYANGNDSVIGPDIDQFNIINKEISTSSGVNYLDVTGISRQAANNPNLIASDGLHPSALMYNLWVQLLAPAVAAQFKK